MNDELKAMLKARKPSFDGAVRRKAMPQAARELCAEVGRGWAKENKKSVKQAVTLACFAYWELFDERK